MVTPGINCQILQGRAFTVKAPAKKTESAEGDLGRVFVGPRMIGMQMKFIISLCLGSACFEPGLVDLDCGQAEGGVHVVCTRLQQRGPGGVHIQNLTVSGETFFILCNSFELWYCADSETRRPKSANGVVLCSAADVVARVVANVEMYMAWTLKV